MSTATATLYVVATPIGNRDDITLRAIDVLRGVDRIAAEDTRHTRHLLAHHGIERPMLALHEHNEDEAAARVVALLQQGESLALVSDAGTPLISDPGFPLVRLCRQAGIEVVPVPGPSALIAALSASGLPTDRFRFEGFLPRRQAARIALLETLRRETATLAFYESSHRIVESLGDLVEVMGDARPACMARELTKSYETIRTAPLGELLAWVEADENQRKGEFVLLIGGAPPDPEGVRPGLDELLRVLLDDLPLKQAVRLTARITGENKNRVYERALQLSGG